MLKMLSGCMSAMARVFSQREAGWADAEDDEINEAMKSLLEQRYGWYARYRGSVGPLYHKRDGNLAYAAPQSFWPASSWNDAMKATKECVEGGMKVNLSLRKDCRPRHLCVQLLTMCKVERPVPEIVCAACGKTARRFEKDAKADGWLGLFHSQPWSHQKFPVNGWGYVGRCPSCTKMPSPQPALRKPDVAGRPHAPNVTIDEMTTGLAADCDIHRNDIW